MNGANAIDDKDGDITNKIVVTGKVDTKKAGTYIITYTVEDSAKNIATVKRTIIVKKQEVVQTPESKPDSEQTPTPGSTPGTEPNPEPDPIPTPEPTPDPEQTPESEQNNTIENAINITQ